MAVPLALRRTLRREVLLMCFVVFLADCVWSLQAPTFSIYANSLGASLALVGLLGSLAALTQFVASVPIGLQSDKRGRKVIIVAGFGLFALAMMIFAVSTEPWMLVPGRILFGLATTATFVIGVAYIGDVIRPDERGVAFGLYATSMGLGATVGPLIGSAIEPHFGIPGSYVGGAIIAIFAGAVAAWGLIDTRKLRADGVPHHAGPALGTMVGVLRNPSLLAACIATFAINISFSGVTASLFPIFLAGLGVAQVAINAMYSGRSFVSSLTRLPASIIANRTSRWLFIFLTLGATALANFGMAQTQNVAVLFVLLLIEGVAFGSFLSVGQSFISEHSEPATRGAAVGAYSTAGSMGSMFSPVALGVMAEAYGIVSVFYVASAFALGGMGAVGALFARGRRASKTN